MKLFKKEERDPFVEEAFANRLAAIAGRTKSLSDPYRQEPGSAAA